MRIVGIDYGRARIGIAWSDESGRIALPKDTVNLRKGDSVAGRVGLALQALVDQDRSAYEEPLTMKEAIARLVVGLPLRLDGSEGEAARQVRAFAKTLRKKTKLEIVFWDERLTTVSAERALSQVDVRGRARRAVVDQTAAAILLQSYLDAQPSTDSWPPDESLPAKAADPKSERPASGPPSAPRPSARPSGHPTPNGGPPERDP